MNSVRHNESNGDFIPIIAPDTYELSVQTDVAQETFAQTQAPFTIRKVVQKGVALLTPIRKHGL